MDEQRTSKHDLNRAFGVLERSGVVKLVQRERGNVRQWIIHFHDNTVRAYNSREAQAFVDGYLLGAIPEARTGCPA